MPNHLSSEAVERYRRDGYVHPIDCLSPPEAKRCRDALEDYERRSGQKPTLAIRGKGHLKMQVLYDLVHDARVLDAVESVLGPNILCWGSSLFVKEPNDPAFVAWHQDSYYWGLEPDDVCSAWIAFAPSTIANGAMQVLPGSHKERRYPHAKSPEGSGNMISTHGLSKGRVIFAVVILVTLLFSKNVYQASLGSYYTFYLMERFHLPVQTAQLYLVAFLIGIVLGTLGGGWVGDKVGRIPVMWFSILGALPFALILPHANLFWTAILAVGVAAIMASAFPAILVYAQELLPGRVGLVAGMFFGFSFGLGGLGAAALGKLADMTSIETVYQATPFLLCLGLLTALLPRQVGEPKNAH